MVSLMESGDNGIASESGAIVGQMDVLKVFALDDSVVARNNVQYVLGNEVPCKEFFHGKRCKIGKLIPTEGFSRAMNALSTITFPQHLLW